MAELTVLHNPRCSKSRAALSTAEELGVEHLERRYLEPAQQLSRDELLELLAILEDEPRALVRRDPLFGELGLADEDVATAEQVATLLAEHPALLERPVLILGDRAIIGRPTERVAAFLGP